MMYRLLILTLCVSITTLTTGSDASEDQAPLSRVRRQFFGGITPFSGGGFSQTAGARVPLYTAPSHTASVSGSLSQSFNAAGQSSPLTYGGGADWSHINGHGLSGGASITPGVGNTAFGKAQVGLVNTPDHKLTAWGSHSRVYDTNWNKLSHTNAGGADYSHSSGLGLSASGSQTPGMPNMGTVGVQVPLINQKDTQLNLGASRTFIQGMKPVDNVGINFSKQF